MFLPGSQFRRINESDIAVHRNFLNQKPIVCKAGTVIVGDEGFDMHRWLTRLENMPETLATTVA